MTRPVNVKVVVDDAPSGADVELIEVEAWTQIQRHVSDAFRERVGVEVHPLDGGVALLARHVDMLALNRTLGLGITRPLTEEALDALIARYRAAGVSRFVLQWSPAAQPSKATEWILSRGFRALPRMVKLGRTTTSNVHTVHVETTLEIVEVGPEEAARFAATAAAGHEVDPMFGPGFSSTMAHPGWRHYLAFDGEHPVSAAALLAHGDMAWFGFGATLSTHRGRGGQSALLARRLRDAAEMGCRWASCETTEETPDRPNPSFRNMRRMGFHVVHARPNFLLDLRTPV